MLGNGSNYIELPTQSHDKVTTLKNALGQDAAKPFYIWANDDCANKCDSFEEAKAIRLSLFNEGGKSVHIVDADGVEAVDSEIEAHEALAKAGYYVGTRNPEVKPEVPGAFMVNDPQDPDGFAIVGDDIAALILEARDHLIDPAAEREVSNYIEHPASGKTGTFAAKYDQHAERNGQTFTVLGAVDPITYDTAECGEMFFIRFADGMQIEAWPEEVESAMKVQGPLATGEWIHHFNAGEKETRCRIVVDMEQATLIAAQEWTGLKFDDVAGDRLQSLSNSVIDASNAHFNPDAFGLIVSRAMPAWADGRELSKCTEPLPSQAIGHTAYEVTVEDVENVLRSNSLAVANTDGKSFEAIANELHGNLDFDLIEQAALAGDDLDEQTDYANDEIARQLREMGILEPLKQAQDSPSPGM